MTVVAVGSVRGAPGATSCAIGLSRSWPAPHVVLLEADPSGGVLAARTGLAHDPGLVSLASNSRPGAPADLVAHGQPVSEQLSVVCGPSSGTQARAALSGRSDEIVAAVRNAPLPVVIDVGRVDQWSPALPLARAASMVVLVARPYLEQIEHLISSAESLRRTGLDLGVVLIGERPYGGHEVDDALGDSAHVLAVLPDDARSADAIGHGLTRTAFGVRRSAYARALIDLSVLLNGLECAPVLENRSA